MGQEVALIRLVQRRVAGRLAEAAVDMANAVVAGGDPYGGTVEWYPFLWSCAVTWLIESGTAEDLAAAQRAIEIVEQAPVFQEPATRAQLPRLRATLALADTATPVDPVAVERDLREAVPALEAYGAVPDRARTQLLFGRFLAERGRPQEAASLLGAARSTFEELGMPIALSDADAALAALPRTA
jgi:hypothetical protein